MVLNTLDAEELANNALIRYRDEKGLRNNLTLSIGTVEDIADSVIKQIISTTGINNLEDVSEELVEDLRRILDKVRLNLFKRGQILIAPPPEEN